MIHRIKRLEKELAELRKEIESQPKQYAEGVTDPELLEKFRVSCKRIIKQEGVCIGVHCEECQGSYQYNNGESCRKNGWRPLAERDCEKDLICKQNAERWLKDHPRPQPKSFEEALKIAPFWGMEDDEDGERYIIPTKGSGIGCAVNGRGTWASRDGMAYYWDGQGADEVTFYPFYSEKSLREWFAAEEGLE